MNSRHFAAQLFDGFGAFLIKRTSKKTHLDKHKMENLVCVQIVEVCQIHQPVKL